MNGIVFGLLYAVLVAIGKIVLKKSFSDFKPSVSFFWETFFAIVLWIPVTLYLGVDFSSIKDIWFIVLIGAILSEAYIFYVYTKGDISIIGSVFPTYALFTMFFSMIILGERPNSVEIIAAFLIVIGVISISISNFKKEFKLLKNLSPILWALSGAFAVGIADSLAKGAINETSSFTLLFVLALTQIPVSIAFLILEKQNLKSTFSGILDFEKYKLPLIAAFILALSQMFFWFAFEETLASVASPITSSNIMFTAIFSYFILKEQFNWKKVIGIILVFLGLILIGIF